MEAQKALLMYVDRAPSSVTLFSLACACGSGASTACFNATTTGTLVAESKIFCGLNSTVDTGFASAIVANSCPAPVSSIRRRRRLVDSTSDTSTVAWSVFPLGTSFHKASKPQQSGVVASFTVFPLSPVCGSSELSPLVVTSAQGVVYGQLLGPGQGFNVTSGQATSVQLCLSLSANVHNWSSLFDTVDVASYQGGVFAPLNLLSFLPSTSDQLCFAPTQNGTYFPIQRASAAAATTTAACSPACATNSSICVYNMTAQSAQCLCRCGFSGSTCATTCLNQCSYQGRCFDARTNDNDTSSNDSSSNHNVHADDNISYNVVANANADQCVHHVADTESDNAILWSDSNDISSTDASANQLVNVFLVVEFVARFKSAKRRAHSFTFLFFLNSSNRVHTKATDIFSWELNELKRHNDHDAAPDDGNTRICRPNDCNTRNDGGTSDDIARADKERRPHTA
ncbi:unnamed protein product [Aphanomyces euteiches]